MGLGIETVYQYVVNDKAWQSTYRKDEFDENLRYVTAVVSET